MNNKTDESFFENKYVRKAFESTANEYYDPREVMNSFWKKYPYIKVIRNVHDAAILMKGEDNHRVLHKVLKLFCLYGRIAGVIGFWRFLHSALPSAIPSVEMTKGELRHLFD